MKFVVAETVFLGKSAFETLGEVFCIPDRQIGPEHLQNAQALIIRSKTKITAQWMNRCAVRFVGTATAGFEHIDFQSLENCGIAWRVATGCNADSVAQYIITALLHLHTTHGVKLNGKTLGIVGIGQIGSRVANCAKALGLRVRLNDPPRAHREGGRKFQSLKTLLAESDIITLHVPLITDTPWPTLRLANDRFFEQMKPGATFLNTSRGQILDNDALLNAISNGIVTHTVLDVWHPEPRIRPDMLAAATIGTPHIAGHSLEGKLNGTIQIYHAACQFFGKNPVWDPTPLLPAPSTPTLQIDSRNKSDLDVLAETVSTVYNICDDQLTAENMKQFDLLRTSDPSRRELKNTTIILSDPRPTLLQKLKQLKHPLVAIK